MWAGVGVGRLELRRDPVARPHRWDHNGGTASAFVWDGVKKLLTWLNANVG